MNATLLERRAKDKDVKVPPVVREKANDGGGGPAEKGGKTHSRLRLGLMVAGFLAVGLGTAYYWFTGGRYASTDDAYIRAAQVAVTTDVSGIVTEVLVKEGQSVRAGDELFRIDPRQYQIALDNAKASLAGTGLTIDSMKADYQQMLSDIAAQEAVVANDQLTYDRFAAEIKGQLAITKAQFDQARYALEADKSKLASLQNQAKSQLAKLGGDPSIATEQHPLYLQARARADEAQRQLDHTVVRAPFNGRVTQVDSLQPGVFLVADTAGLTRQGAVALVSTDNLWVDADLKETDLTYAKPGNPVEITVDTYPGVVWTGTVDSISPAAASDFSILPAQNASGNWVKVVQRITVRIKLEQKPGQPVLRSGMSVEVAIDTGHRRSLSDLF